jgi:tetratricopeptide (TPR) repeat protein
LIFVDEFFVQRRRDLRNLILVSHFKFIKNQYNKSVSLSANRQSQFSLLTVRIFSLKACRQLLEGYRLVKQHNAMQLKTANSAGKTSQGNGIGRMANLSNCPSPNEINMLMALLNQQRFIEAEQAARAMTMLYPRHGFGWMMLSAVLTRIGSSEAALHPAKKAAELSPNDADAHSNLGFVLNMQGNASEAEASFRKAIKLKPDFAGAHFNLGNALQQQRRWDEAEISFRNTIKIVPNFFNAHHNLGCTLNEQQRWTEAEASFRRALMLKPDFAAAHHDLGNALIAQGKLIEAQACYRRALEIAPKLAEAHCSLGNALKESGQLAEAESCCRHALLLNPLFAAAHYVLAITLHDQGRHAEAEISFQRTLEIKPDYVDALVGLGDVAAGQGRFADAEVLYRRALTINPQLCTAWAAIAGIRKMTSADTDWITNAEAIVQRGLPKRQEATMRYAMGKFCDDAQDFEQAFKHYQRANELVKAYGGKYDQLQHTRDIDQLCQAYHSKKISRPYAGASASAKPIFIVGMPRSGTSLIEQILASHPAVFGAGELTFWMQTLSKHRSEIYAAELSEVMVRKLADDCLQNLSGFSADALRVIDKMPINFSMLGLIHAVFPNARILHTQRNPIDTCLSIYFQNFGASHVYANDLEDLAHYYREYHRLMAHWRATLPTDRFLDVAYEALVEDQQSWSRKIIEFIDLDWDERCLDFHKTERKVATSSNWQVRQKIYKSSKERWRNYEQFAGPLLGLLELDGTKS